MTREKILAKISWYDPYYCEDLQDSLSAVVELHKPVEDSARSFCSECSWVGSITIEYPCPTIRAIEEVLE